MIKLKHVIGSLLSLFIIYPDCFCDANLREIIDVNEVSKRIEDFVEDLLQANKFQHHLDSFNPGVEEIPSKELSLKAFQKIATDLVEATIRLRDAIEDDLTQLAKEDETVEACCTIQQVDQYDIGFERKVDRSRSCYFMKANSNHSASRTIATMINSSREIPLAKWQYVDLFPPEGLFLVFPALQFCWTNALEAVISPWYAQAAILKPLQLVIAIDISYSMSQRFERQKQTKLEIAIYIAKKLIFGLTYRDKFTVLAFNSRNTYDINPRGLDDTCFFRTLVRATSLNKNAAYDFLDGLKPRAESTFRRIILVSDEIVTALHDESSDTVADCFKKINDKLNFEARIFAFGIGVGEFDLLGKLPSEIIGKKGFQHVKQFEGLNIQIVEFFKTLFSTNLTELRAREPFWSSYNDLLNLGEIFTTSLPVYAGEEFVGVAAIDILFRDVLLESVVFRPNQFSYAFVVNDAGLLLHHPALPFGQFDGSVLASVVETDENFTEVLQSIMRGENGNKTCRSKKYLPFDSSSNLRSKLVEKTSVYMWKKIEHTPYHLCKVFSGVFKRTRFKTNLTLKKDGFLFHRLDLVPPKSACSHRNILSSTESTTVFIEPKGFYDPASHAGGHLTASDVEDLAKWIDGSGENKLGVKPEVREDILITNQLNKMWNLNREYNYNLTRVAWRFVITHHGVIRLFPGISMYSYQRLTDSMMYNKALLERDSYVFGVPYIEPALNLPVITVFKTLHVKRTNENGSISNEAYGVAGLQFIFPFYDTKQAFSGSLVDHEFYFLEVGGYVFSYDCSGNDVSSIKQRHLSELEPYLFASLVQAGIARRYQCSNFRTFVIENEYSIALDNVYEGQFSTLNRSECYSFFLQRIPKTTALVLVKSLKKTSCNMTNVRCECEMEKFNVSVTRSEGGASIRATNPDSLTSCFLCFRVLRSAKMGCQCPCSSINNYFDACRGIYTVKNTSEIPNLCITSSLFGIRRRDVNNSYFYQLEQKRFHTAAEEAESSGTNNLPVCYHMFVPCAEKVNPLHLKVVIIFAIIVVLLSLSFLGYFLCRMLVRRQRLHQRQKSVILRGILRLRAEKERRKSLTETIRSNRRPKFEKKFKRHYRRSSFMKMIAKDTMIPTLTLSVIDENTSHVLEQLENLKMEHIAMQKQMKRPSSSAQKETVSSSISRIDDVIFPCEVIMQESSQENGSSEESCVPFLEIVLDEESSKFFSDEMIHEAFSLYAVVNSEEESENPDLQNKELNLNDL